MLPVPVDSPTLGVVAVSHLDSLLCGLRKAWLLLLLLPVIRLSDEAILVDLRGVHAGGVPAKLKIELNDILDMGLLWIEYLVWMLKLLLHLLILLLWLIRADVAHGGHRDGLGVHRPTTVVRAQGLELFLARL